MHARTTEGQPKAWHDPLKLSQRLLRPGRIGRGSFHVVNTEVDVLSCSKGFKKIPLVWRGYNRDKQGFMSKPIPVRPCGFHHASCRCRKCLRLERTHK